MMNRKHKNIPIFVPHIGCPNDCSFCNQKKITGVTESVTPEEVDRIISEAVAFVGNDTEVEVAFFGGSFTGIEKNYRNSLLSVAKKYVDLKKVQGIRLSTRPDYIDDEILNELKSFGVTDIELGVQSMDDEVLAKNRRGHTAQQTKNAAKLIKEYNFRLGLQMMPGLFGDTKEKTFETAKSIIKLEPDCVRIYPTIVIRGTWLHELFVSGKYIPLTTDEAVEICAELVPLFLEKNIKIIRMGLMATDVINEGKEVLAGPFHPSFGELVESEILFEKARKMLIGKTGDATFTVNPKTVSAFIGNKKKNIKRLSEITGGKIKVCQNENYGRKEVTVVVS